MMKMISTALVAAMLVGTAATAQQIQPLDTTAATQVPPLPVFALGAIPTGAIVVGTVVVLGGVVIGVIAADDSNVTTN